MGRAQGLMSARTGLDAGRLSALGLDDHAKEFAFREGSEDRASGSAGQVRGSLGARLPRCRSRALRT